MPSAAVTTESRTLSVRQQQELDAYERVGHLLSILKSKARRALRVQLRK